MALVALGVTGGIGAYKAVEVARGLQKADHDVVVVMTQAATEFVGPLTFEAITRHRVITGQFDPGANADIEHIALASSIELLIVAPATANIIGKFAAGVADDFLSTLYLATRAPVMIAPAMNTNMWEHVAVQRNLQVLTERGVHVVAPGEGFLACGWTGKGRLAEPADIVAAADTLLRPRQSLAGRHVVVTAGPTFEDIDPVRFVGNRSSGRMGFALAAEAARRGATVTLVAGPTSIDPPDAVAVVRVRRAAEMRDAIMARAAEADVIIMAAAVADYAPQRAAEKITKDADELVLRLTRTPDILAALGTRRAAGQLPRAVLVGFAAETSDVVERARSKRLRKQVDLIVANDVSRSDAGFDVDRNAVTLVSATDERDIALQSKAGIAQAVIDRIEELLAAR
ncbi:MAG TPA: bifunctional phosphopantothenoylcysteine decarboxylase/phosphopantothenate--cysteine ligase CoaBC [Vicinamibacterales bacterium]|jgi:phosphopantothenoylcysteine decarboxylase/phosphopantothenate--cysteine ligase